MIHSEEPNSSLLHVVYFFLCFYYLKKGHRMEKNKHTHEIKSDGRPSIEKGKK